MYIIKISQNRVKEHLLTVLIVMAHIILLQVFQLICWVNMEMEHIKNSD